MTTLPMHFSSNMTYFPNRGTPQKIQVQVLFHSHRIREDILSLFQFMNSKCFPIQLTDSCTVNVHVPLLHYLLQIPQK